ncbi:MAG: MBL fold metallo-hydrolase [Chloroflexi bacterium]|nr:MBL fold metallo-hydrolase [Chloroflexota bacterium]
MIFKALSVGPYMSNCYIVGSETTKEGLIIDPGAEPDTILNAVDQAELKIKLIVATHGHIDHVTAVNQVKEKLDAPFAMHEAETVKGGVFGKSPDVDQPLKDGDVIEIGDLSFTVRHTPGHSLGGIVLIGHGIVFSGDTLFQYSIGRTDFPDGSHSQLMTGIFEHLMILPDETVVYSGHGPQTTIGMERQANPFVRDWARRIAEESKG